jgi:hypothetical protein
LKKPYEDGLLVDKNGVVYTDDGRIATTIKQYKDLSRLKVRKASTFDLLMACVLKYRHLAKQSKTTDFPNSFWSVGIGRKTCPLCLRFNFVEKSSDSDENCIGCPVYNRTQEKYCNGTPFEEVFKLKEGLLNFPKPKSISEALTAEADFLESLIPKRKARILK